MFPPMNLLRKEKHNRQTATRDISATFFLDDKTTKSLLVIKVLVLQDWVIFPSVILSSPFY